MSLTLSTRIFPLFIFIFLYAPSKTLIPAEDMNRLFDKAAKLGVGIELNFSDMRYSSEEEDIVLRPYRIAKECGCKFYCGSDAHHPRTFNDSIGIFNKAVDSLELTEEDKFII